MAIVEHVALMEHLLASSLPRGSVDVDAMALVYNAFHRPAEPLRPVRPHLPALLWALAHLPERLGAHDTLWVVSDSLLDVPPGRDLQIGPNEWARSGGYAELRRAALALSVVIATSRQLREGMLGEDTLGELAALVAEQALHPEHDLAASGLVERLALAIGFEVAEVAQALEQAPGLLERLVRLAQHAFLPALKVRGIGRQRDNARAQGLWRELLGSLAALDADTRPLVVWVAPLWVTDLVSPYTREVQPLLARWARDQAGLPRLAEMIASGDPDATYLCANLFSQADAEVLREREQADTSCGIYTVWDPNETRMAKVCDTQRLEAALVDPRLGDVAALEPPAPIVIVLNEGDPDIEYALGRLLCDVSASYRGISVCASGQLAPSQDAFVGHARMAQGPEGPLVLAAPARSGKSVRPLTLPDMAYLALFGARAGGGGEWPGEDRDCVFETHRIVQRPLGEALWRGDLDTTPIAQRFWLEPSDDRAMVDAKRAHIADALGQWRAFLGVREELSRPPPDDEPRPPSGPVKPLPKTFKAGSMRFRA